MTHLTSQRMHLFRAAEWSYLNNHYNNETLYRYDSL
jgi:hypothetical protein